MTSIPENKVARHGGRNDQLDGLRGYAALAVVFFHSILGIDPTLIPRVLFQSPFKIDDSYDRFAKAAITLLNGHTAVAIFFILSGAVLFDSLDREKGGPLAISAKFAVKRFLRIYPALFVCLILCWIAFTLAGMSPPFWSLLINLTLFDFPINGATWTLNVEAFGALFLLLAYLAYRKIGEAGIILVGALFASAYLPMFKGYLIFFKPYIYAFALGMLIPTRLGAFVIRYVPSRSWPVFLIALLVSRHTIQETVAALLIGLIYYRQAGKLGDILAKPFSVFLGSISYSLYLFNVLFLEIINTWLRSMTWAVARPVEVGLVSGLVIVALTVPVAYASLLYIERPSIDLGRRLAGSVRKQTGRAAPALDVNGN